MHVVAHNFTKMITRGFAHRKALGVLFAFCAAMAVAATAQTFNTLISFDGTNGANPMPAGSLIRGTDGYLYGTAKFGGKNNGGTIFKISPDGELTTLYSFCSKVGCSDGQNPNPGLVLGSGGSLYGTTYAGGTSRSTGVVFKLSPQGHETTLHVFAGQPEDGSNPSAALIFGPEGDLYGTTYGGGEYGDGTIFKITTAGAITTIFNFDSTDGSLPGAALVLASDGKFYGTTQLGGSFGNGTVFQLSRAGKLVVVHNFAEINGSQPVAPLIQATDGNLYGTTQAGGIGTSCRQGCGTVFKVTPQRVLTKLHDFDSSDGASPDAALIQATDGNFYGAAGSGGLHSCPRGCGTIFEISASGQFSVLKEFAIDDGEYPGGGMLQFTNGLLYGPTFNGGANNLGTLYSLDMRLGPFVAFVNGFGNAGQIVEILGQGFTGTTAVMLNGTPASFTVVSDTFIKATVPAGATTGYVAVTTPGGTLTSNVPFHVIP